MTTRHNPMSGVNHSFRVESEFDLTYETDEGVMTRSFTPGEHLWLLSQSRGKVWFIDDNGEAGYYRAHSYDQMASDYLINMTHGWISPEQARELIDPCKRSGRPEEGDALQRMIT